MYDDANGDRAADLVMVVTNGGVALRTGDLLLAWRERSARASLSRRNDPTTDGSGSPSPAQRADRGADLVGDVVGETA